jgi:hypothetical protein
MWPLIVKSDSAQATAHLTAFGPHGRKNNLIKCVIIVVDLSIFQLNSHPAANNNMMCAKSTDHVTCILPSGSHVLTRRCAITITENPLCDRPHGGEIHHDTSQIHQATQVGDFHWTSIQPLANHVAIAWGMRQHYLSTRLMHMQTSMRLGRLACFHLARMCEIVITKCL